MTATTNWVATAQSNSAPPQITVNGIPFFARGVAYSPVPWGGDPNWTPFGDYMFPPWNAIWERDLPLMRSNNINVIRTYNIENVNPNSGASQDHTKFLDACWNNGVDPIYVLAGFGPLNTLAIYDPWEGNSAGRDSAQTAFLSMVTAYASHPAIMGFIVGNEVNNVTTIANPKFWAWIDGLASGAKQAAPGKLAVMGLVDDSMNSVTAGNSLVPNLDVWGINSYRGQYSPANLNNFTNLWNSYAAASTKPLLLTEWGAPASTHDANGNLEFTTDVMTNLCTYITGHMNDIVFNSFGAANVPAAINPNNQNWAAVCAGGCYFEWTDEWWKMDSAYSGTTCPATVQNPGIATNSSFPGGWDDEECFGLNAIAPSGSNPNGRPGPTPNSCPGPWDFAANTPYPPDTLTPRDSLSTLYFGICKVPSTVKWQDTGITVSVAETVLISYLDGAWTSNPHNNNGELFSAAGNPSVVATQKGYTMVGQNEGALIGRISDSGAPFLIGNGPVSVIAQVTGNLQLCINDDLDGLYGSGLKDNIGSVTVRVNVS